MLNIKNKYKAFHISFHPHTSLTAGLNIFEKTFHSRRKRMHIHIYTCKWICLPAINQKSKLQYHQSPSLRMKKNKTTAPTQIYQSTCAQSVLSRQLLKSDIDHSFKNGISNTHTIKRHLSEHKQKDNLKSFICYRWVTFGVNKKGHIK